MVKEQRKLLSVRFDILEGDLWHLWILLLEFLYVRLRVVLIDVEFDAYAH